MKRLLMIPLAHDVELAYRGKHAVEAMGLEHDVVPVNDMLGIGADKTDSSRGIMDCGEFLPADYVQKLAAWVEANGGKYDLVWTNNYSPACQLVLETMRAVFGCKIVADVDDWFESVPLGNPAVIHWYTTKKKLYKELLEKADRVTASTPFLAEKYDGVVCPNFTIPESWAWGDLRQESKETVFMCAHGMGRAGDYMGRAPEFKKLLELPNTKMVFVGSFPDWAVDYPAGKVVYVRWVPWKDDAGNHVYHRVMRWLAPDVLLSPMEHNDFNLAKSNLKWLEAGMLDAVFVGERWGEYERTVEDGVTGVLADGREEWAEKLLWLAQDAAARKRIAKAGREEVVCKWTWPAVESAWRKGVLGDG